MTFTHSNRLKLINILLFTSMITACGGDDDDDRRSDPNPTMSPTATPTSTPSTPPIMGSMIIEAETGVVTGVARVFEDTEASGGEGIAFLSEPGASVTWSSLPAAEAVTVHFASQFDVEMGEISANVNGEFQGVMQFEPNGVWTGNYASATYAVSIPQNGSLGIEFIAGNTPLNIDFIELLTEAPGDAIALRDPTPVDPAPTPYPFVQPTPDGLNKYEPEDNRVIVFIGQDNLSVGGNVNNDEDMTPWDEPGYVEAGLPLPAGITSYIALRDDSDNDDANVPEGFTVAGLHNTTDYGAGPICLACYLENSSFNTDDLIVHLSIFYADDRDHSQRVAEGETDEQIREIATFIKSYPDIPFMVRPGYEFDFQYRDRGVAPFYYQEAFRHIVDIFRQENVTNFASVYSSGSRGPSITDWENFYPGNDYVDWIGYSVFLPETSAIGDNVFAFARTVDKPVFASEVVYADQPINDDTAQTIWNTFFTDFFGTFNVVPDQVKALAYINADWRAQPLWQDVDFFDNTDSRLESSTITSEAWTTELENERYILDDDNVLELIRFND